MNYLDQIVANKQLEIALLKTRFSYKNFMEQPYFNRTCFSFKKQVQNEFGVIAEFKRKSPSAGILIKNTSLIEQIKTYEEQGAIALSILTDKKYFEGSIRDIEQIRKETKLPILRKEFILDEIQIFESKACGADAILLIAAILDREQAHHLTILAKSLGLEVIFEIHSNTDLLKINEEVDCVLINNRDLKNQVCDLEISNYFSKILRTSNPETPLISASGIKTSEEIFTLETLGFSAVLIGESIIRNNHLHQLTAQFITL